MLSNCGVGEDSWESLDSKEITPVNPKVNPAYSLEELIMQLKIQYFGHLMWRANSLEKTLMLGKIEGWRRRGWQKTRWLDGIIKSMYMSLNKLSEVVKDSPGILQSMGLQRAGHDLVTEQQQQRDIQKSVYLAYFL